MVAIEIDNYIRISGISKALFTQLRKRLTYDNPSFVNATKYGRGFVGRGIPSTLRTWDFVDNQLCLPRGIMMELFTLLGDHGIKFNVTDRRNFVCCTEAPIQQIELRDYQEDLVSHAAIYPGAGYVIQSPPGTGKTLCGLELARRESRKTLWITHTKELAQQTMLAASDEAKVKVLALPKKDIGFIGSGNFKIGEFLTIALIQSLQRKPEALEQLKYEFGTIIIDEVHHSPATTWRHVIYQFAPAKTIGLTATSYRPDGLSQMLFDCIGPVVACSNKELLVKAGVMIVPDYYIYYTGRSYSGESFQEIVSHLVDDPSRNRDILSLIIDNTSREENNVVLFLSSRVKHVNEIERYCYDYGVNTVKLIGSLSKLERSLAYERLRSNPGVILATDKLLGEGFDHPPINTIIIGTPFKNPVVLEQMVGRAQRLREGKTFARIIDMSDNNAMLAKQSNTRRAIAAGLGMDVAVYPWRLNAI